MAGWGGNVTDFTAVYAACVQAVLLGAFTVVLLPDRFMATPGRRIALAAMVGAAAMVPFASGASLMYFSRGLLGDPSVSTVLLLLVALFRTPCESRPVPASIPWWVVILGLPLYLTALGAGGFDLYEWGYGGHQLLPLLLFVAAIHWRRYPALAGVLGLGMLAWHFRLLESTNLWDYLLDPMLFVWAFWQLVRAMVRRFKLPGASAT
jgi:hypothetical protein